MSRCASLATSCVVLSFFSCNGPERLSHPGLPPEYAEALAGRETVEFRGLLYAPAEPVDAGTPDDIQLRLARLTPQSVEYSFDKADAVPGDMDGDWVLLHGNLPYVLTGAGGVADRSPPTVFELRELVISRIDDLKTPSIDSVGGVGASQAKDSANPPSFDFALIELGLRDFDIYAPPEIKIFDHGSGKLIHEVGFRAKIYADGKPVVHSPQALPVPIVLAHDTDPWSNSPQKPSSRTSRIELHFLGKTVDTVFAKIEAGIWVVPVVWHNVREKNSKFLIDDQDVRKIFWTPAEKMTMGDVNSIFRKARVQFRLIEIRDHLLPPGESSSERCDIHWSTPLSSPDGVDIYAVEDLYQQAHPGAPKVPIKGGFGGCHSQGHILISEYHCAQSTLAGQAHLVAHELGHYVGAPVTLTDLNNLMYHPALGTGWDLTDDQKSEIHKRLRELSYNEKK